MIHLEEEQLVHAYYGESDSLFKQHIEQCPDCRAAYQRLKEILDSVTGYPVPERNQAYGAEVWARLTPHLPLARPPAVWQRWWVLGPAFAALLAIAFWAGVLTEHRQAGISVTARQRVLLLAISDHLERSQILLTELSHANAEHADFSFERTTARDLLTENRLLRESALRAGDIADAGLLDELERVFLNVANGPATLSANDLEQIQQRIESEGLLFKVRITRTDAREKGQKL
ncbi:MAG: hypothetical protein JO319_17270 [Acidobacteriaceae bacterium]|nr:hypothetical protein [Acidobacteriaceae bacterium]